MRNETIRHDSVCDVLRFRMFTAIFDSVVFNPYILRPRVSPAHDPTAWRELTWPGGRTLRSVYEAGRLYGRFEVLRQCTEHKGPTNVFFVLFYLCLEYNYGCRRTSKKLLFSLELVLPASSFLIILKSGIYP